MRDLKVRVWDKQNRKMHCDIFNINFECACVGVKVHIPTVFSASKKTERIDVMFEDLELLEFTGIRDTNRREIYDGDIVQWTSLNVDGSQIGEVTFFEGCWFIQGQIANGMLNDCMSIKKLGTIYENAELMEVVNVLEGGVKVRAWNETNKRQNPGLAGGSDA